MSRRLNKTAAIEFHYLQKSFTFRDREEIKRFILRLIKTEGHSVDHINYIFCSDAYLLQINQEHLNHNTLTDIITFQLSPKSQPLLSDIYISVDRVRENAGTFQVPFSHELLRVMFHGALHLCGFKDKSVKDSVLMRSKEDFYLGKYLVSRGTK